jgi:hypothetical protein
MLKMYLVEVIDSVPFEAIVYSEDSVIPNTLSLDA